MSRTDRLPLLAVALATLLGVVFASSTGAGTGTGDAGRRDDAVVASAADGGLQRLTLVDPGGVTDLAAAVIATTSTTTTTTTAPPPPPTTTAPKSAPVPSSSGRASAPAPAPAPAPPPPPPAGPTPSGSCAANFGTWMNSYRNSNGVAPLTVDGGIAHIPLDWSMSMARNQNLAHNPNYVGQVGAARPQAGAVGENVGYNSRGDRAVFDNMVASPGHRGAILNGGYTHVATGCVVDGQGKVWVTVDFWG